MIRTLLRRLARMRMPAMVFAAVSLTGCTAAQLEKDVGTVVQILTEASQWESDAVLWIDRVQGIEQAVFAAAPNSAAQAALEAKINDARALLQTAGQAAAAEGKDLSSGDLTNAYAQFVAAAKAIDLDVRALVAPIASSHVAGAAVAPAFPALPLCVLASTKGSN